MKPVPSYPGPANAPAGLFEEGHLWIQEVVTGDPLGFRLESSGAIEFAGRDRSYGRDPSAVPPARRLAVRRIRTAFDRGALREAVDDVESVRFTGVATRYRGVAYDWERTPAFLGFDVRTDARGPLPPDAVEKIYEAVGLAPAPARSKEVRAADFDPDRYAFPESEFTDGPVAGVVVRNKRGDAVVIAGDDVDLGIGPDGGPTSERADRRDLTATDLVDDRIDDRRLERARKRRTAGDAAATPGPIVDDLVAAIARETPPGTVGEAVEPAALRAELGAVVRAFLDER